MCCCGNLEIQTKSRHSFKSSECTAFSFLRKMWCLKSVTSEQLENNISTGSFDLIKLQELPLSV